jgi:hypothetical protein
MIGAGACIGLIFAWLIQKQKNPDQLFEMIVALYVMAFGLWLRRTRVGELK